MLKVDVTVKAPGASKTRVKRNDQGPIKDFQVVQCVFCRNPPLPPATGLVTEEGIQI